MSWKNPLVNYCILTFCRWWVCLSWTPPCQKEQETKTGKTVVRIWILPWWTQGVTTIAVPSSLNHIFGIRVEGKWWLCRGECDATGGSREEESQAHYGTWVTGWNKVCKTYYWKEMELWHFKWFSGVEIHDHLISHCLILCFLDRWRRRWRPKAGDGSETSG